MLKIRQLIKTSVIEIWRYKSSLFPVVILIMAPVTLLSMVTSSDQVLGSYGSFATLIMNVAVIYSVMQLKSGSKHISLAEAFYVGTRRLVTTIGVIALLGLQMIPLLLGGLIYVSGSTGATVGLGPVELMLLAGIWLLFATPSLRWLTRTIFGLYFVQGVKFSPMAAVKQSSSLVRGKSWSVFLAILAGAVLMFVVLIIPSLAISTLPDSASSLAKLATGLLQVASALALVPFATIYGYNILEAIGGKPTAS